MQRKREPTRVHTRKIDRGVARKKLRDSGTTISKKKWKNFAKIWRILSE